MNEIGPINQLNGREASTEPYLTFHAQITERPIMMTAGDGAGVVVFKAMVEEEGQLHKRRVSVKGKDLVNFAFSLLNVGKVVEITGEYHIHSRMKANGQRKNEKRIRATGIRII